MLLNTEIEEFEESPPYFRDELGSTVRYNILWDAKVTEYLVEEGLRCFEGGSEGTFYIPLENRSTTTRTQVKFWDLGRSVMKSTPRWDQGCCGMGRGTSLPISSLLGVWLWHRLSIL